MRLIDATIQPLLLANYILERKNTFIRVLEKADNDFLFGMLMDYFGEQPTAYDVDKVVEQLEEEKEYSDADYEAYAEERGLDAEDDWHYSGLKRAIEIVKAGGIDER